MEKFLKISEAMNEQIDDTIEGVCQSIPSIVYVVAGSLYIGLFYLFITQWK